MLSGKSEQQSANWSDLLLLLPLRKQVVSAQSSPSTGFVHNSYAVKAQEAGSGYAKYPGHIMDEHFAPSTIFHDIDKMIGK